MRVFARAVFKATGAHGDAQTRPIKFVHVPLMQRMRSRGASISSQISTLWSDDEKDGANAAEKGVAQESSESSSSSTAAAEERDGLGEMASAGRVPRSLARRESEYSLMDVHIAHSPMWPPEAMTS
jgi:hypothetical protein